MYYTSVDVDGSVIQAKEASTVMTTPPPTPASAAHSAAQQQQQQEDTPTPMVDDSTQTVTAAVAPSTPARAPTSFVAVDRGVVSEAAAASRSGEDPSLQSSREDSKGGDKGEHGSSPVRRGNGAPAQQSAYPNSSSTPVTSSATRRVNQSSSNSASAGSGSGSGGVGKVFSSAASFLDKAAATALSTVGGCVLSLRGAYSIYLSIDVTTVEELTHCIEIFALKFVW